LASVNTSFILRPASAVPFDELVKAFNDGYAGYHFPVQVDALELRHHIERHSIDLNASRVAIWQGIISGVALLGIRNQRGWIGGLGVHPDYRRRGAARTLMQNIIAHGRKIGLSTIQLEVIVGNTAAYNLYRALGFTDRRLLLVLERQPAPMPPGQQPDIQDLPPQDIRQLHSAFHRRPVLWQRDIRSLDSSAQTWAVIENTGPAAYVLGYAVGKTLHILDLACAPERETALQNLIIHLHNSNPDATGRLVNLGEDEPAAPILASLGWREIVSQYEMVLQL